VSLRIELSPLTHSCFPSEPESSDPFFLFTNNTDYLVFLFCLSLSAQPLGLSGSFLCFPPNPDRSPLAFLFSRNTLELEILAVPSAFHPLPDYGIIKPLPLPPTPRSALSFGAFLRFFLKILFFRTLIPRRRLFFLPPFLQHPPARIVACLFTLVYFFPMTCRWFKSTHTFTFLIAIKLRGRN